MNSKKNILIIENSHLTSKEMFSILSPLYNLELINKNFDKIDYCEFIKNHKIDLIILDINLNNKYINGINIAMKINQNFLSKIPILILSGILDEEILKKLEFLGCCNFLNKICTEIDFLEKVNNLLRD